jgi:hypothetical protein
MFQQKLQNPNPEMGEDYGTLRMMMICWIKQTHLAEGHGRVNVEEQTNFVYAGSWLNDHSVVSNNILMVNSR